MKTKGEFLFESYEEALKFIQEPTNYERAHNISIKKTDLIVGTDDIKLIHILKTDNTKTLFIFFRNSTIYDIWKFWCPSQKQFNFIVNILPAVIKSTDKGNKGDRV